MKHVTILLLAVFLVSPMMILPIRSFGQEKTPLPEEEDYDDPAERDLMLSGEETDAVESMAEELRSFPLLPLGDSLVVPDRFREVTLAPSYPPKNHPPPAKHMRRGRWEVESHTSVEISPGGLNAVDDSLALGGSERFVNRLQCHAGRSFIGCLTITKKAEESARNPHLFGSLDYAGTGTVNEAILGDFLVSAGEGLVLSRSRTEAGSVTQHMRRSADELRPYHGVGTERFLRGGALSVKARLLGGIIRTTAFTSYRSLAATVTESGTVSSIDWYGNMRTEKESRKQGAVHERLSGLRVLWAGESLTRIGMSCYKSAFDREIVPISGIGFSGRTNDVWGFDGTTTIIGVSVFGELAWMPAKGSAAICGLMFSPSEKTSASVAMRSYGKGFVNLHASAMGAHGDGSNERGIRLSWFSSVLPTLSVDGSADFYQIPYATSTELLPQKGVTLNGRVTMVLENVVTAIFRLRLKRWTDVRRLISENEIQTLHEVQPERQTVTCVILVPVSGTITARTMITVTRVCYEGGIDGHAGALLSLGLGAGTRTMRWEVRGALFESDGSDAPVSDVESGIGRQFSSFSAFGNGSRVAASIMWRPLAGISLSGKCSETTFSWKPSPQGVRSAQVWPSQYSIGLGLDILF